MPSATTLSDPTQKNTGSSLEVRWEPELLDADVAEVVEAFRRAIHGYASRRSPADGAAFLLELDSAIYPSMGVAAIRAEAAEGRTEHPKHRLMNYHQFFMDQVTPGQRVLDLGCGWGVLSMRLAAECKASVVGIDFDRANVARAEARAAQQPDTDVTFMIADIMDIASGTAQLDETTTDVVILSNVLEHLKSRPTTLRGLAQQTGASTFLIRVPAFDRDWRVPYKHELGLEWRLDETHEIEHTEDELRAELAEAGFVVESFERRWGEYYVVAKPNA